jgi:uncharacterized membrane protein
MSTVRESIDCAVPVSVAYERLCHFENYPQFMSGVKEVTQLSDTVAHFVMDLGGRQREFDAQITDQRPGELLAWTAVDGPRLTEKVMFQQLADNKCRIIAELDIDAQQLMPSDAHAQETLDRRLKADLSGLKTYVEAGLMGASAPLPTSSKRGSPTSGTGGSSKTPMPKTAASAKQGRQAPIAAPQAKAKPSTVSRGRHERGYFGDDDDI